MPQIKLKENQIEVHWTGKGKNIYFNCTGIDGFVSPLRKFETSWERVERERFYEVPLEQE